MFSSNGLSLWHFVEWKEAWLSWIYLIANIRLFIIREIENNWQIYTCFASWKQVARYRRIEYIILNASELLVVRWLNSSFGLLFGLSMTCLIFAVYLTKNEGDEWCMHHAKSRNRVSWFSRYNAPSEQIRNVFRGVRSIPLICKYIIWICTECVSHF